MSEATKFLYAHLLSDRCLLPFQAIQEWVNNVKWLLHAKKLFIIAKLADKNTTDMVHLSISLSNSSSVRNLVLGLQLSVRVADLIGNHRPKANPTSGGILMLPYHAI